MHIYVVATLRSSKMKKMNIQLLAVVAILAAALMVPSSAHAQSAAATYKAKCATCHGADGKGDTSAGKAMGAHDFASPEDQKLTDADLAAIIAKGKNKMPAYGKSLKDSEITDLVRCV